MGFYDELSKVYSIVFPADEDTVNFLLKGISIKSRILDAACATGDFSIELAQKGNIVDGVDLSTNMIEIAKAKSNNNNLRFIEGDMTCIKQIYAGESFDMIYCIGNSIVHLNDKNAIAKFIADCFSMLKRGGKFIVQTVNYDRIVRNNVTELPLIEKDRDGIRFERKYNYKEKEGIVDFITHLTVTENGLEKKYDNSVPLIPLMRDEIYEMLKAAGYENIQVYGSFSEKEYIYEQSYALVIRAEKL